MMAKIIDSGTTFEQFVIIHTNEWGNMPGQTPPPEPEGILSDFIAATKITDIFGSCALSVEVSAQGRYAMHLEPQ